jgi:hypothetical protein
MLDVGCWERSLAPNVQHPASPFKEKFMKHPLFIVLLVVVLLLGIGLKPANTAAGAINLTGTWNLQYMPNQSRPDASKEPIKMTFVFKQEGEKLSGTFSGVGPTPPAQVTGFVKGSEVVFGWEIPGNRGTTQMVVFKGKIESATKMTGTVGPPFCRDCNWTATMTSKKTKPLAVPSPKPGQSPKSRPQAR